MVGPGLRVAWWEADYIVQRQSPEGDWYAVGIVQRPEGHTSRSQVRAAIAAVRAQFEAGQEFWDPRERRTVRWDGTRVSKR